MNVKNYSQSTNLVCMYVKADIADSLWPRLTTASESVERKRHRHHGWRGEEKYCLGKRCWLSPENVKCALVTGPLGWGHTLSSPLLRARSPGCLPPRQVGYCYRSIWLSLDGFRQTLRYQIYAKFMCDDLNICSNVLSERYISTDWKSVFKNDGFPYV